MDRLDPEHFPTENQSPCPGCHGPEPLHQHEDGNWYWFDETWADEYGPYATMGEAVAALERYCEDIL